MIILHFDLQLQFKYMIELFHIYFTSFHSSRENELNKLTSLPMYMYGFIAQLVEHRAGIRGGHGFESCWSRPFIWFFQANRFFFPIA